MKKQIFMDQMTTPTIYKPEYLVKELVDLLNNNPRSAPRFFENLMNVDYNFSIKDGFYKLLNQEQRDLFHRIHIRRKESEMFNQQFQIMLMILAGSAGLIYGAVKLAEHLE